MPPAGQAQGGLGATSAAPASPIASLRERPIIDQPVVYEAVASADVWIGPRAVILLGVRVGSRANVAAGAAVHRESSLEDRVRRTGNGDRRAVPGAREPGLGARDRGGLTAAVVRGQHRRVIAPIGVFADTRVARCALALATLFAGACTLSSAGLDGSSSSTTASTSSGTTGVTATTGTAGGGGAGAAGGGGGAGGQGGTGTGGQGGAGGSILYTWQAGDPPADGVYVLPPWLKFSSPTAGRTSQTGPSTIRTGFAVDAPRARNTGSGWGLTIESARTNYVKNSVSWSGAGWVVANMAVTPGSADPSGGSAATLFSSAGSQRGNVQYLNTLGLSDPITASTWCRGTSGAPPYAHFVLWSQAFSSGAATDVTTTSWNRVHVTAPAAYTIELDTIGGPNGEPPIVVASALDAYGAQVESPARYPSSLIPSGDSPATRAAESLWSEIPGELAPLGWVDATITFAPHYKAGEQMAQHDLVFFDLDNRVYVDLDSTIVARFSGVNLSTNPLSWDRDQVLTVSVRSNTVERRLGVAGATTGDGETTAAAVGAVPLPAKAYFLGNASGSEEGADLRGLSFAQ